MRGGAIGRGAIAVALLASACTSFGDADSKSDAGPSVVATDAGTTDDGGMTDGGLVSSCPSGAFCDAFERGTDEVLGAWGGLSSESGTAEIAQNQAHTGGGSFHVHLPQPNNNGKELLVTRPLDGMTHVTTSFWLRKAAGDRRCNAMELNIKSATTTSSLLLIAYNTLFVGRQKGVDGTTFEAVTPNAPKVTPNTWMHVEIAVTVAATGPTFAFKVDGNDVSLNGTDFYPVANPQSIELGIGIAYATGNDDMDIWYDDVAFQVTP